MNALRSWILRLWSTIRRTHSDIDGELASHLQFHIDDNIRAGMTSEAAQRDARIRLGGVQQTRERVRDGRGMPLLDAAIQDVRYSGRMLRKRPGFASAAVLTLALGIGANTAMFSVINTVLLRPLPYPDPDRLVAIGHDAASPTKFNLWKQDARSVQQVSAYRGAFMNVTGGAEPEEISCAQVSSGFFPLLGAHTIRGRTFSSEEDRPHGDHVAVLSYGLWRRRFNGALNIVGTTIELDSTPYTVVGILSPDFDGETLIGVYYGVPDAWVPMQLDPNSRDQANTLAVAARLTPGQSIGQAQVEFNLLGEEFRRRYAGFVSRNDVFTVEPLQTAAVSYVRTSLLLLSGAVLLVLLIACANLANLLLARATARTREFAVRAALGAGRSRLIRQLLTESLLLSFVGAICGLGAGMIAIRALVALSPGDLPRIGQNGAAIALDWHLFAFTLLLSLATTVIAGLIPALQTSRTNLIGMLKDGAGHVSTSPRHHRARSILVVAEMTLALVLLVGAALLIRTLVALRTIDTGVDLHNVLTMRMSTRDARFMRTSGVDDLVSAGLAQLRAVPGVVSASASYVLPVQGYLTLRFTIAGRPLDGPYHGMGSWGVVSPSYFDVFKIPLIRGRLFNDRDVAGSPGAVIINETMARQFWPNDDPLAHQLVLGHGASPGFDDDPVRQIVGIVGDVRERDLARDPAPTTYVPIAQLPDGVAALNSQIGSLKWSVRTRGEPHMLDHAVQHALQDASGGLPVAHVRSMDEVMRESTARANLNMVVLTIFGSMALVLAVIGIYGVMAYSVRQRTREIGIRLALGADIYEVRNMVLRQGMKLALLGVSIGLVSAFVLTRVLATFLFGVTPHDTVVFISVPVVLSAAALVAVWLPAQRATQVDPLVALRAE